MFQLSRLFFAALLILQHDSINVNAQATYLNRSAPNINTTSMSGSRYGPATFAPVNLTITSESYVKNTNNARIMNGGGSPSQDKATSMVFTTAVANFSTEKMGSGVIKQCMASFLLRPLMNFSPVFHPFGNGKMRSWHTQG